MRLFLVSIALLTVLGFLGGVGKWPLFHVVSPLTPYILTSVLEECSTQEKSAVFESSPVQHCYNQAVTTWVKTFGLSPTVAAIKRFRNTSQDFPLEGQRCHALAHEVGNAAARIGM